MSKLAIPNTRCRRGGLTMGHDAKPLGRAILLLDGLGCAAAAAITAVDERPTTAIAPGSRARVPITLALAVTSASLLLPTRRPVLPRDLNRAALINCAWVATCLTTLAKADDVPPRGRVLLALTASLDGVAGLLQFRLGRT